MLPDLHGKQHFNGGVGSKAVKNEKMWTIQAERVLAVE
jgi:hypothetical protein